MKVVFHPDAEAELGDLPTREKVAVDNVVEKLKALGTQLGYPHCSAVQGAEKLRELRPRSGRSPWRAFYRRVSDVIVIASIGPEAKVDRKGFDAAVRKAERRLAELEEEE